MKETPVVNRYLICYPPIEVGGNCLLTAPKPGCGIQKLELSKTSHPNLYEVFLDLAGSGFDLLDVDKDIGAAERDLLIKYGVLIDADKAPEQALYCCLLDEVKAERFDGDRSDLIVNPSFRFAEVDFSNLASRIQDEHLSGRPSAWIAREITGIEIGYWFDNSGDAAIVEKFEAGERLPFEIEPELLGKLYSAGIVTTEPAIAERTKKSEDRLKAAHEKFIVDKYTVIPEILPKEHMTAMRVYYRKYVSNGFMPFDDTQSERYYQHNEPFATVFHKQLTKLMGLITGEEVIPSYVYAASYVNQADLKPHTDREQCEFSISFQVDYFPEQEGNISPWGLFVRDPEFESGTVDLSEEFPAASESEDPNTAVYLASGDGVIYKGRELIHYRYPLPAGHQSTSLFFHYVPKDFEGELR